MNKNNKKQRPEYIAWRNVCLAQIKGVENNIQCLGDEVKAHKELLKALKNALKQGDKDESKND